MAKREYILELDEAYIKELERIARELGVTPGEALPLIGEDLAGLSFGSGMTVATADGARPVLTRRSRTISY
jgi:hypothetical protein